MNLIDKIMSGFKQNDIKQQNRYYRKESEEFRYIFDLSEQQSQEHAYKGMYFSIENIINDIDGIELKNKLSRNEILKELSKIQGVYVPLVDNVATKRIAQLTYENHPVNSPIPHFPSVHDRAIVELRRGCGWLCRFCQASHINLPIIGDGKYGKRVQKKRKRKLRIDRVIIVSIILFVIIYMINNIIFSVPDFYYPLR